MEKEQLKKLHGLEDALKGDDEEISEIYNIELKTDSETTDDADTAGEIIKLPITRAPRKIYVTIAVVMLFFSIIGAIVSINFVKNTITDIREQKSLKEEFALFIYPVVINDPPSFSSVDNLRPQTIITSAIWKIILTGNKDNYAVDMGAIYVPAADVELSAHSIFGVGIQEDEHQTVSTHGIQFIYSSQNKRYEIPVNPTLFSNSPLVTSIRNIGEVYIITVDYIAPSPLRIAGIENDSEPIKTMIYTISRTRERMTITSIQAAEFDHF